MSRHRKGRSMLRPSVLISTSPLYLYISLHFLIDVRPHHGRHRNRHQRHARADHHQSLRHDPHRRFADRVQQPDEKPHREPRDHRRLHARPEPRPNGRVHPQQADPGHEIERHPQRNRAVHRARLLAERLHRGGHVRLQPHAVREPIDDVQHHPRQQPAQHHATPIDPAHSAPRGGRQMPSTPPRHYEPTQPPSSNWPQGTTSTATIPPSPSGTVATPLGTTQSDPSTCRLKWYNPRRSTNAPSQTSSPKGRSWTGCHAFQSPAIATERASGIRNRTTRLSPRGSGTRGAHCGAAVGGGGRGERWNRTPSVTNPARGSPW